MLRILSICLLFGAAALALWALAAGGESLEVELPGGLPTGNALAALVPAALAGAGLLGGAAGTAQRRWAWLVFAAALCWLPASVALAGNPALNFAGGRGEVWLSMSLALMAAIALSLAWAALAALATRFRGRRRRRG